MRDPCRPTIVTSATAFSGEIEMLRIVLIVAAMIMSSLPSYSQTCNGEARATCEANGGNWNSGNCSCN